MTKALLPLIFVCPAAAAAAGGALYNRAILGEACLGKGCHQLGSSRQKKHFAYNVPQDFVCREKYSSGRRMSETPTTTTFQKSIAVHLQFVLQYASNLYCSAFGAIELSGKGNTSVRRPFVSQHASHLYCNTFVKILVVVVTGMFPSSGRAKGAAKGSCGEGWLSKRVFLESPFLLCPRKVFS